MAPIRLFVSTLLAALLCAHVLAFPIHQRAPVNTAPSISTASASPAHKATSGNIDENTAEASDKYELSDSNNEVVIPSVEDKAESPSASTQLNKVYPPVDSKLDPKELNRWKTSNPISTDENSNEKE